jgi:hypothetical protein
MFQICVNGYFCRDGITLTLMTSGVALAGAWRILGLLPARIPGGGVLVLPERCAHLNRLIL